MKTLILYLLLITTLSGTSQISKNHSIYGGVKYNMGNYSGGGMDINYIYKQKYTAQLQFINNTRPAVQLPSNYYPAETFFGKRSNPVEKIAIYSLLVGRIYTLDKSTSLRINFRLGASYNTFSIPDNFTPNEYSYSIFSHPSNYKYTSRSVNNIGLILRPSLELPLSRSFGITLSPNININNEQTSIGGQLGIIFGILSPKKAKLKE